MKPASLKAGGRKGALLVVSKDLSLAVLVPQISKTIRAAGFPVIRDVSNKYEN
ncbi:hypothetical protein [Polynucleobacter sp. JS-JIR-II-c23]|uniref:hypothetical protein n=1 Tax=Polynucleobacter sp. JS-JIR-II-c23 TaxID=1758393 RepID=UPI003A598BA0